MRKVASHFYTFENNSAQSRSATFAIAFRDCSRTRSIKDHAFHLEAQYIGEHFQKLKPKAVLHGGK